MRKAVGIVLVLIAVALIGGCIDYSELLELNADGSGTMAMQFTVHKKYFDAFGKAMGMESSDSSSNSDSSAYNLFKREDFEKQIAEKKLNVKLLDFSQKATDSTLMSIVKFSFKSIKDMMTVSSQMGKQDMSVEPAPERKVVFEKQDAGWHFLRDFQDSSFNTMMDGMLDTTALNTSPETTKPEGDSTADSMSQAFGEAMQDMSKMMAKMMLKAFSDCHVQLAVKFPGKIVKTNATKVEGNTATWEYKLMDIPKAPKQLEATIGI
jgi:hypothetical protein